MVTTPRFPPLLVVCGLLALGGLLTGCPQGPPKPTATIEPIPVSTDHELHFDERYLDSISLGPPWSARTQREIAIKHQLSRLRLARRGSYDPTAPNDSVFDMAVSDGPLVGYPNRAAELADIYRRIDSLKVLEHIPLTPH